jgi:predicted negative regulator of RcsB-dependent stress response
LQQTEDRMFEKIKNWYKAQTDTTKALIWIGLIAIIGIIIRWDAVVAGIKHGFGYYSGK